VRAWVVPMTALLVAAATHGAVIVTGASMEPTLSPGDVCIYRRTERVRPGQVVVFEREDSGLVVHRAVTVGLRGEVRSKGDANGSADGDLVAAGQLRGPVVVAVPIGRLTRR
jgi:signal peptidase I